MSTRSRIRRSALALAIGTIVAVANPALAEDAAQAALESRVARMVEALEREADAETGSG